MAIRFVIALRVTTAAVRTGFQGTRWLNRLAGFFFRTISGFLRHLFDEHDESAARVRAFDLLEGGEKTKRIPIATHIFSPKHEPQQGAAAAAHCQKSRVKMI
jgi:hypothetical protein